MLDEDFLFAMASKASATYISSHISDDGEGTVFFSLSDWDNLKPSLSADGWDGDTMPGFIDLLDAIAAQGYNTVEFHISHPLVVGAVWFTDEYYFTVTRWRMTLPRWMVSLFCRMALPTGWMTLMKSAMTK